eukprot:4774851-Amphidinium_carterae.1
MDGRDATFGAGYPWRGAAWKVMGHALWHGPLHCLVQCDRPTSMNDDNVKTTQIKSKVTMIQAMSLTLSVCMRRAGSECARQLGCHLARCTGTTM